MVDIAEDDRFQNLLTRPEYAIDKTDQRFKPSKSMDKLLGKMREKRPAQHVASKKAPTSSSASKADETANDASAQSLDALVASVKRKAKQRKTK